MLIGIVMLKRYRFKHWIKIRIISWPNICGRICVRLRVCTMQGFDWHGWKYIVYFIFILHLLLQWLNLIKI